MSALKDIRVIELAESVSGEYCGKLLSDFGAQVLKIEQPPSGSPTRKMAPFVNDEEGKQFSGLFAYLNTNKQSILLDVESFADNHQLRSLLQTADVVIDDHDPDWQDAIGLLPDKFRKDFPSTILALISPFGRDADKNQWNAKSSNIFHDSGWGYHTPTSSEYSKPPLDGPGRFLADYEAGLDTALCIVSALYRHLQGNRGDGCLIDISKRDVMISRADLVLGRMLIGADEPSRKRTAYDQAGPSAFFPCADGAVYLYVTNQKHWIGIRRLLREPAWMEAFDENWLEFGVTEELVDVFRSHFGHWIANKKKFEISEEAQHLGIPLVPVNNARDVYESPQFTHRNFFKPLPHTVQGEILYPSVPYKLSATPATLIKAAPELNEHDPAIFNQIPERLENMKSQLRFSRKTRNRGGPLAGVRVVEITKVWAGPFAGKLLAMLGAEVIKVESHTNLDELRAFGGVDINNAPYFLSVNQEVLSMQANMKKAEGRRYVQDLIARSDIVINNLRPGAMERLGMGYRQLAKIKDDIISVSIKMFGNEGPLGHQTGYAPCFTALAGLSDLVGYEAGHPLGINMRYGDATVGANAALAAIIALTHRELTGEGQFIDVSAVECMSSMVGDCLLEYALTGNIPVPEGNRHPDMCPHGCYPCLEDEWISIAVDSEEQWRRLCKVLGKEELASNPDYDFLHKRRQNQSQLDSELSELTRHHSASILASRLLEDGIGAAKSMSSIDLMANHDLWHREIFRFVSDHSHGKRPVVGVGWQIPDKPVEIKRGAPLLGEHNNYVYGDILGLTGQQIDALKKRQIIY